MKKFLVLVSLGVVSLGGYSFGIAMSSMSDGEETTFIEHLFEDCHASDDDCMEIEPLFADLDLEYPQVLKKAIELRARPLEGDLPGALQSIEKKLQGKFDDSQKPMSSSPFRREIASIRQYDDISEGVFEVEKALEEKKQNLFKPMTSLGNQIRGFKHNGDYEIDPAIAELDERMSRLALEREKARYGYEGADSLRDMRQARVDQLERELDPEHAIRGELCREIVKYGKTHSGGEFLPEGVRRIEEERALAVEPVLCRANDQRKEFDMFVQQARKDVVRDLSKQQYVQPDMRALNATIKANQNEQQAGRFEREQSWVQEDARRAQYAEASVDYSRCAQELLTTQRGMTKEGRVLLSSLQHVETEGLTQEQHKELLAQALREGKGFKALMSRELQREVVLHQARIMKLLSAPCATVDKGFKFARVQKDLMSKFFFTGPEGLEAGKFVAFQSGNILALIGYMAFLDQLFASDYLFGRQAWTDLLETLVMMYVRIAQDVHAVATVDALIDTLILEQYPLDARLTSWRAVSRGGYFTWSDLDYCEHAQGTILSYLLSIWMPRLQMAEKAGLLPDCSLIFDRVNGKIASIDSAAMPTPAIVCCLGKAGEAWDASGELEQVFRMFDFREVRQEGADAAFEQLKIAFGADFAKGWSGFLQWISANPS